jgi:Flp pilus assembly protein TadG
MAANDRKNRNMLKKLLKREDGVVTVEFIILFPLYLLILVGIIEFGHLWYVRHALTNASREGARAAVVYYTPADTREAWATATAKAAVKNYLSATNDPWLKSLPDPVVTFPDVTAATGNTLTVTVTSPSGLLLLDELIPAFKDVTVSAETTMRLE